MSAFPFLQPKEIRDIILGRTEHNVFVLCNTAHKKYHAKRDFHDITANDITTNEAIAHELSIHETTIQTIRILQQTGRFPLQYSLHTRCKSDR